MDFRVVFLKMDPDPGANGAEPAPWELYNIDLVPSEVFLKFRKEMEEYRLGVNVEVSKPIFFLIAFSQFFNLTN